MIPGTRISAGQASVAALQAELAAGRLTAAALTAFYLQRIDRLNPALHAVLEVNPDAPAEAAASDAARQARAAQPADGPRGPLDGIPVLIKDNIQVAGMPTTAGSPALLAAEPADAVVVGWTRRFDFDLLATAATAIRLGARFIGTNEDPTHPTPQRLLPGSGAILAAVATAAQATPEVAGKPHGPLVALLRSRAPDAVLVVGDRPSTDGALARRLGLPFALVRTGVTSDAREPMVVEPDEEAADLGSLVTHHLGGAH